MISCFSRTQFLCVIISVIALRLAIGSHFYIEGTSKLKDGDFSAVPFLKSARGPLAKYFHSMLEDEDASLLLCVEKTQLEDKPEVSINPRLTFLLWEDFADQAASYYRLGSQEFEREIQLRRDTIDKLIVDAKENEKKDIDTKQLQQQRDEASKLILVIRQQLNQLDQILAHHKQELENWLSNNRVELIAHYSTRDRLVGFDRDGAAKEEIAEEVGSLRDQVASIRSDRSKKVSQWSSEVKAIWDSLETRVNDLRVDEQLVTKPLSIHRPFDQPNSKIKWINRIIPWFDTTIGLSLIFGLFTRWSALLAAGFLLSIVATQPPWLPGSTPTFYQMIEMFGLVVLATVGAGKYLGIDALFSKPNNLNNSDSPSS